MPKTITQKRRRHTDNSEFLSKQSDLKKALQRLKPHDHLCLIYETQDEWLNAITPFMAMGNRRHEIRNRNGIASLQA